MTRRWRKVETAMWGDLKFRELSSPPPNGKTLWLYLLTGPRTTTFPGLVLASEETIASDLKWTLEGFREAFREVSGKGMAKADWEAGIVVLPRALMTSDGPRESSRPESPNVIKSWAKSWSEVPEGTMKDEYLSQLETFARALGKAFGEAFAEAFAKGTRHPSPNQEKEKEKEKEKDIEDPVPPSGETVDPSPKGPTKSEVRAAKVPSRAWLAADYMRTQLLVKTPNLPLGKLPWGDDVRTGRRLDWADTFRLMHEKDGLDFEEIAKACHWLFNGQGGTEPRYQLQVESPATFREKWPKIAQKRQEQLRIGPRSAPASERNVFAELDSEAEKLKQQRGIA